MLLNMYLKEAIASSHILSAFRGQVSTWAKRSWKKSIKTLSGGAVLMMILFLLQAEMTQNVRGWSFLKKLLSTYSENLERKRREWRPMCP